NYINLGNSGTGEFFVPRSFETHYRNATYLEKGGYGTVIALESKTNSREGIAVKRFDSSFDTDKRAQRCYRELQLLSGLNHENIVKMKFAYTTDANQNVLNAVYLTTEFAGFDLGLRLSQETPKTHKFSLLSFQKMISELLRALKYLNSANVIHRDLKPDNLAIDDDGKLTLLDFGIARVMDKDSAHTTNPGAAFYRAIETMAFDQNSNRQIYNEKADIWSIGAILCQMITGKIVFSDEFRKDRALLKAIEICGPIPESVIKEIGHETSEKYLRNKSATAKRIDFIQYFRQEGRLWLWEEIQRNQTVLVDFINRTLAFDHRDRMNVDEALAHPFLASVREPTREVLAGHSIPDVGDRTLEGWRELIWGAIQASPVRFD
ncbi:hypothetical protein PENTCL1PPCAC_16801, partial [Pristionchus entomophagus]